ncbi:MAG: DUF3592 domain-containing protein [Pseudomonadota bacterium]
MSLEGVPALFAILGMLIVFCLPFAVLFWVVKRFFFGMKQKVDYIKLLLPDGVPITGTITRVRRDRSGGYMRTYSSFEYTDQHGQRHIGEVGGPGYSEGDPIELMYLPDDPKVHEIAQVIAALREKAKRKQRGVARGRG